MGGSFSKTNASNSDFDMGGPFPNASNLDFDMGGSFPNLWSSPINASNSDFDVGGPFPNAPNLDFDMGGGPFPKSYRGGKPWSETGDWDFVEVFRDIGSVVGSGAGAVWDKHWLSSPIDSTRSAIDSTRSGVSSVVSGVSDFVSWLNRPTEDTLIGKLLGVGKFNGGVVKAQYGRYLGGFQSSMVPVMAHGGEYVMSARAVQNIGLSNLEGMNHSRNYQGGGGGGTNIFVENFIGEPEWFESMMGEYNVSVAPKNERSRGLESRKISSMADNNRRGRV
jgi:hypothetical protein